MKTIKRHNFQAGQKVRIVSRLPSDTGRLGWNDDMDKMLGGIYVISRIYESSCDIGGWEFEYHWIRHAKPLSKRQKLLAARAERLAAKKAAAEAKAKALADAKAKADRMNALAALGPEARAAADYFHANPGAFGCQKSHVIAIVEILAGEKIGGVL